MVYTISKPFNPVNGSVVLDGSKSISNRALIIRALCSDFFPIHHLSGSTDTRVLQELLQSQADVLDAGSAGTTFRFLTAYLAFRGGSQILTGTERMKQRPIAALVNALRQLGADIEYLEVEDFPPLRINSPRKLGLVDEIAVPANTSSQFLSALLMLAPLLPNGLTIHLNGDLVSKPYLDMTLKMMAFFGVQHSWKEDAIHVDAQPYRARELTVEADWSAASYYYALAALSEKCSLQLNGLYEDSWQGDAALAKMMQNFGVETIFHNGQVQLSKRSQPIPLFEWDFLACPDIVQTLAVVCAGLGVHGLFSGLETLRIKETDRIDALQKELSKIGVFFSKLPNRFSKKSEKDFYLLEGKADVSHLPLFETYGDHRMAMAFTPLAMLGDIQIVDPDVVEKSYPSFWEDLQKLGFRIHSSNAVRG